VNRHFISVFFRVPTQILRTLFLGIVFLAYSFRIFHDFFQLFFMICWFFLIWYFVGQTLFFFAQFRHILFKNFSWWNFVTRSTIIHKTFIVFYCIHNVSISFPSINKEQKPGQIGNDCKPRFYFLSVISSGKQNYGIFKNMPPRRPGGFFILHPQRPNFLEPAFLYIRLG